MRKEDLDALRDTFSDALREHRRAGRVFFFRSLLGYFAWCVLGGVVAMSAAENGSDNPAAIGAAAALLGVAVTAIVYLKAHPDPKPRQTISRESFLANPDDV